MIKRQTALSAHVVQFCRYLREQKFQLGPAEELDALEAMVCHVPRSSEDLRAVLKATLVRNLRQLRVFDQYFTKYWKELGFAEDAKIRDEQTPDENRGKPKEKAPSIQVIKNWLYGNRNEEEVEMATFSPMSVNSRADLSSFSQEETGEVMRVVREVAKKLAKRPSRRYVRSKKMDSFDLRRSIRNQMKNGGDLTHLFFKKKKERKSRIVLLCDVSKSMDLYSRFLIQVLFGFQNVGHEIETFVFSTTLSRVTGQLKNHTLGDALEHLADAVPHWSGGTQIGGSLSEFVKKYGGRFLDRRTIVMILSDGWDIGETTELSEAMKYIQQKSYKVIWLNPLAGQPGFEPKVKGMQAALPFIDVFAPAHDLESLRALAGALQK